MRPSGRLGRRWNSIRCLSAAQNNLARVLFFAGKLDEADAVARKSAELQPAAASSHRWQVLVAVQRGDGETALREAQLEPTKAIAVSNSRSHNMCAEIERRRTRLWPISSPMAEISWPIKSLRFTLCAARKTKLSSGYKSPLIITTPECSSLLIDPLLRGLRNDPRYKNLLAKVGLPTPS